MVGFIRKSKKAKQTKMFGFECQLELISRVHVLASALNLTIRAGAEHFLGVGIDYTIAKFCGPLYSNSDNICELQDYL